MQQRVRLPRPRFNGRRGAYLLLHALLSTALALSYLIPAAPTEGTARSLVFVLSWGVPIHWVGITWASFALIGLAGAFSAPPGRDGWAYTALAILGAGWGAVYLIGTLLGVSSRGWVLAVIWFAIAGSHAVVAGMVDAGDVVDRLANERETGDAD